VFNTLTGLLALVSSIHDSTSFEGKPKEYEKAEDSEDLERLIAEIEMLRFVLCMVCRNNKSKKA
jgi:hypothetical protein